MTTLHPQYITDNTGQRISVIVPVAEFEALLEDLSDLASLAERRDESTVSHEQLLSNLKRDGLL